MPEISSIFFNRKTDYKDDALACHFVDDRCSYNPFAGTLPAEITILQEKIHKQIAHITYDRAIHGRIDRQFRRDIRDLIEKEIDNFGSHLRNNSRYNKYADLYRSDFSHHNWPTGPNGPTGPNTTTTNVVNTVGITPMNPPAQYYRYLTGGKSETSEPT